MKMWCGRLASLIYDDLGSFLLSHTPSVGWDERQWVKGFKQKKLKEGRRKKKRRRRKKAERKNTKSEEDYELNARSNDKKRYAPRPQGFSLFSARHFCHC